MSKKRKILEALQSFEDVEPRVIACEEEDTSEFKDLSLEQKLSPSEEKETLGSTLVKLPMLLPLSPVLPFSEWAETWNVSEALIRKTHFDVISQQLPNAILFVFCLVKGITEKKFQMLFLEATDQESARGWPAIPTPNAPLRHLDQTVSYAPRQFTNWWLTSAHPLAIEAQRTLTELLFPGPSVTELPHAISFSSFVSHHPQWDIGRSWVFFRDDESIRERNNILIQRRQLSGNCYIHGPIVCHHYLMCKYMAAHEVPVAIDIRKFILRVLPVPHLAKLICHVGGGSSREIFKMLLEPRSDIFAVSQFTDICTNLLKYGPALVTGFGIEKRFRNDETSYSGALSGRVDGSHSMVAIGFRTDEQGNIYILFQNWWNKQFVECDASYFQDCGATALFTRKQVRSIPPFSVTTDQYAEAEWDGDDLAPEEYDRKIYNGIYL